MLFKYKYNIHNLHMYNLHNNLCNNLHNNSNELLKKFLWFVNFLKNSFNISFIE